MRARKFLVRLALALAGTLVAFVALGETWLRLAPPAALQESARERSVEAENPLHPRNGFFELDEELGYRPVLDGQEYGAHGCVRNEYTLEKPPGVRRLLFLGDSVTRRGKITAGLRELLGDEGLEYWNAGVSGYSTTQELGYFRTYLTSVQADHVVLTFHLNDFEATPITFLDGERMVSVYAAGDARTLHPWLWVHSRLYRWLRSWRAPSEAEAPRISREVLEGLRELAALVRERGADLTVLVLPWLRPEEQWPPSLPAKHERVVRFLEQLGVRHESFLEELAQALSEGERITEAERDPMHPSDAFGRRLAASLIERGFRP